MDEEPNERVRRRRSLKPGDLWGSGLPATKEGARPGGDGGRSPVEMGVGIDEREERWKRSKTKGGGYRWMLKEGGIDEFDD